MAESPENKKNRITRRQFLKTTGGLVGGLGAWQASESLGLESALASRSLVPLSQDGNPLE
ncbi:MAG: twin-arginine translocation signal domain-containing protein, partial [Anaerolineae bacterium]